MHVEDRFHFRRVHVVAVDDDHVFLPLDDRREPLVVHARDVARVEPDAAVGVLAQRVGGFVGFVPVAFHHLRSADAQLASFAHRKLARARFDVDDLHIGVRKRQTDRAHLASRELRRRMGHGRRFRQAVSLVERAAGAPLEFFHHFDRTLRAAAVEQAHALEPVLPDVGMGQERHEHGRHRREVGRAEIANRRQHLIGIVFRMDDLQGANPQTNHHADGERVDVEVRNDDEIALVAVDRVRRVRPRLGLDDVGPDVPVRQHRSFRRSGRSAGVLQHGEVLGIDCDARDVGGLRRREQFRQRQRAFEGRRRGRRRGVLGERRDDDLLDRCLRADGLHERRQRVERDDEARARIFRHRQQLARRVARGDVDDDRAEAQHRERREDVLRAVGQHDPDPIALDDADSRERRGERVGPALQVEVRQLRAEELCRGTIRPLDRRDAEDVGERTPRVRQVGPHPVVVVLLPRPRGVGRLRSHAIVRPPSTTIVWPVM